jgi:hypothetical protein
MAILAGSGAADRLATPEDLASLLQQNVDTATATLLIETATATVQAMAGQRIVQVVDDSITLLGTSDAWLNLSQIPVTEVTSVSLDGTALASGSGGYKLFGDKLWRSTGWQTNLGWFNQWPNNGQISWCGPEPSEVAIVYTHGYPPDAQELQLARGAVLSLIATVYANPSGAASESIDDYSVQFAQTSAAMQAAGDQATHLRAALRRQYGRRGGLVRIG